MEAGEIESEITITVPEAGAVAPLILERPEHPVSRRDIDPRVLKVLYRLINAGHVAYLVGGGVRDLMMARRPKDFDIATSAHPQQVRDLFRNSRLIGRRFRLVHVFFGPDNIEVATFRRHAEEIPADDPLIRHDNTFGTTEEDAFRRDFTVNALFYDPSSFRVIDYTGGVADLRARLIRTIGEPELRMREDPVRMLRAVRFAAKLGFEIEPETRAAIERHREDLLKASVPRLVEETYRAFGIAATTRVLVLMKELGLLEILLPWLANHLGAIDHPASASVTMANLAALGRAIETGAETSHAMVLACLFADLHLRPPDGIAPVELVDELRERGFARADTDRMRLMLDAFAYLPAPSRRTRRLLNRPYFAETRRLYEMIGPNYGYDPAALVRFIEDPERWLAEHSPERHRRADSGAAGDGANVPGRRRRRGRRGGRSRRRRRGGQGTIVSAPASIDITAAPEVASHRDSAAGAKGISTDDPKSDGGRDD